MVLLVTNKDDVTADYVVLELRRRRLEFVRLNMEDIPEAEITCELPAGRWTLRKANRQIRDLEYRLTGVWYRRPEPVREYRGNRLEQPIGDFVTDQWRQLIYGLRSIPDAAWVNDPYCNFRAECKVVQLFAAVRCGLDIPRTVITNSPRAFSNLGVLLGGHRVAKALYSPLICDPDGDRFVYTTCLPEDLDVEESEICLSPTVYQEALVPKKDIRVTIVGKRVFAARLADPGPDSSPVDWRQSPAPTRWEPTTLPDDLAERMCSLVRSLGLLFGAVDLLEHNGKIYFLEVNPNGEWGWLQATASMPIAESIVDLLAQTER